MNTEHNGAKKGKGGWYGRKAEAKSLSRTARRIADKKACKED